MANWFFCDDQTGTIVSGGIAPDDQAQLQQPPEGQTLIIVADGAVASPFSATPDFTVLRERLRRQIDSQVGALRAQFITDVPGQAQTYEKKEAEARLWYEGDDQANPQRYPFMIAEANVRGISVADVCAEIMAQVGQLTPIAALLEAHRVAAKQAILNAATLPEIVAAARVDWQGLVQQ